MKKRIQKNCQMHRLDVVFEELLMVNIAMQPNNRTDMLNFCQPLLIPGITRTTALDRGSKPDRSRYHPC